MTCPRCGGAAYRNERLGQTVECHDSPDCASGNLSALLDQIREIAHDAHKAANGSHRWPGKAERIGDHKATERKIAAELLALISKYQVTAP